MRDSAGADRSHSMSSTTHGSASGSVGAGSLQRVTKDSLEQQLTAKSLIGKDVHDSSGEKIGEVEDIVLDSSQLPQLASAFMNRDSDATRASGSATRAGTTGSTGARSTDTYAAGAAGDGASATGARRDASSTLSDMSSQARSAISGAMSGGPAAIVSAGGLMGIGQDLIRVPLSQLRYDANEDRVTLNVSRDQISSITNPDADTSSSRAAE